MLSTAYAISVLVMLLFLWSSTFPICSLFHWRRRDSLVDRSLWPFRSFSPCPIFEDRSFSWSLCELRPSLPIKRRQPGRQATISSSLLQLNLLNLLLIHNPSLFGSMFAGCPPHVQAVSHCSCYIQSQSAAINATMPNKVRNDFWPHFVLFRMEYSCF